MIQIEQFKKNTIDQLGKLLVAIYDEDVHEIIRLIDELKFDHRCSKMLDYASELMIRSITNYMKEHDIECLAVKRKGVYKEDTYDYYKMVDGELQRNCKNARWTNTGTLYQAYKQINPKS